MLVDRKVKDDLGKEAELKYTRLRYELEIVKSTDEYGLDQLYVTHESLKTILRDEDRWSERYRLSAQNNWLPLFSENQIVSIATVAQKSPTVGEAAIPYEPDKHSLLPGRPTINLYQDGQIPTEAFKAERMKRTVLSSVTDTGYVHTFAAREEMRSWRFLHLNPGALRQSSSIRGPFSLSKDGGNLPATLARMQAEDEFALTDVSRDMANLVPGIYRIRVEKNLASNEYDVWVETSSDQNAFSAQTLSDGTLRLLAFAAVRNDPQFHGVLCLEEPENGVHPLHLKTMARVLCEMATDFSDPQQVDEPLRQVLITTHSPVFISQLDIIDSLLLTIMPMQAGVPGTTLIRATRMVPVFTPNIPFQSEVAAEKDTALEIYTIDMLRKYLSSDDLEDARNQLNKARIALMQNNP